jgi:nucleoside-triphosphatase
MHVFLCGDKQVGKSTLIRKILEKAEWTYDGLLSFSRFVEGDRHVFLKSVRGDEEGILCGICSNHHVTERRPEVFDLAGSSILTRAGLAADVVVIDEIGSMERDATIYSTCIRDLVNSHSPVVLGVLQDMAQTELAKWLRSRENIIWYRVTEDNREDLVEEISGRIADELFRQTGSR